MYYELLKLVKTYLKTKKWDVLYHSPFSPDVAPPENQLFRSMAHGLTHRHFRFYEEVKVDQFLEHVKRRIAFSK